MSLNHYLRSIFDFCWSCGISLFGVMLFCLVLVTGCASAGRFLAPEAVAQLHDGQPRAEVLQIFGEPEQVTKGDDNRTLFLYHRIDVPIGASNGGFISPFRDDAKARTLTVLLSAQDQVEKFLFSETKPDLNRTFGRIGYKVNDSALSQIESGKTTKQELIALLGKPYAEVLTLRGEHKLVWLYREMMAGGLEGQDLEVIIDNAAKVVTFKQSKFGPRR